MSWHLTPKRAPRWAHPFMRGRRSDELTSQPLEQEISAASSAIESWVSSAACKCCSSHRPFWTIFQCLRLFRVGGPFLGGGFPRFLGRLGPGRGFGLGLGFGLGFDFGAGFGWGAGVGTGPGPGPGCGAWAGGGAGRCVKSKQSDMSSDARSRELSGWSPNVVSQNLTRLTCE